MAFNTCGPWNLLERSRSWPEGAQLDERFVASKAMVDAGPELRPFRTVGREAFPHHCYLPGFSEGSITEDRKYMLLADAVGRMKEGLSPSE